MCAIGLLMLAGTAIQAGGAIMQGNQQAALAEAQAQAQEQAALADARASDFEVMQETRKQGLLSANARAQVGASGVALAGSPTEVLTSNAGQAAFDIQAIQYGSQLRRGQMLDQAAISRFSGKQAKQAGYIAGASALTSGMSKLYDPDRAVLLGSPFNNIFA